MEMYKHVKIEHQKQLSDAYVVDLDLCDQHCQDLLLPHQDVQPVAGDRHQAECQRQHGL